MHFGRFITTHSWNCVIAGPPVDGLYSILYEIMTRVSGILRSNPKAFLGLECVCHCRME